MDGKVRERARARSQAQTGGQVGATDQLIQLTGIILALTLPLRSLSPLP